MTSIRITDNVFMQTVFTHCNLLSILFSFHHSDLSSLVYKWICFLFSPVLIHYYIANSSSNLRPVISSFRHSTESRVRNPKEGILPNTIQCLQLFRSPGCYSDCKINRQTVFKFLLKINMAYALAPATVGLVYVCQRAWGNLCIINLLYVSWRT